MGSRGAMAAPAEAGHVAGSGRSDRAHAPASSPTLLGDVTQREVGVRRLSRTRCGGRCGERRATRRGSLRELGAGAWQRGRRGRCVFEHRLRRWRRYRGGLPASVSAFCTRPERADSTPTTSFTSAADAALRMPQKGRLNAPTGTAGWPFLSGPSIVPTIRPGCPPVASVRAVTRTVQSS